MITLFRFQGRRSVRMGSQLFKLEQLVELNQFGNVSAIKMGFIGLNVTINSNKCRSEMKDSESELWRAKSQTSNMRNWNIIRIYSRSQWYLLHNLSTINIGGRNLFLLLNYTFIQNFCQFNSLKVSKLSYFGIQQMLQLHKLWKKLKMLS